MSTPYQGASAVGGGGQQQYGGDPYAGQQNFTDPNVGPYTQGYPPPGPPPAYQQGYGPGATSATAAYAEQEYPPGAGPVTEQGRPDVENRSVGQLVSELTNDLSTLMRQELELAKAEIKAEVGKAGKGAGMLGGAGFAGYMVALFLSLALWGALWGPIGAGWSGLIVAVIWAVIGAVLYSTGRNQLKRVNPKPERTVDTLQQVPGALKPH
jgi:hypothetical protein